MRHRNAATRGSAIIVGDVVFRDKSHTPMYKIYERTNAQTVCSELPSALSHNSVCQIARAFVQLSVRACVSCKRTHNSQGYQPPIRTQAHTNTPKRADFAFKCFCAHGCCLKFRIFTAAHTHTESHQRHERHNVRRLAPRA